MAKYLSPEAKRQRARRRKMRRLAMFACLSAFVLIVSYGIVAIIEAFAPGEDKPEDLIAPLPSGELVPNNSLVTEGDWATRVGPVKQTINEFEIISPDHRMIQLPENGSVDLSYFSDAVFVGDSLTEGLRIYTGIDNSIAGIAKFVSTKSLTPKSFIEGVINFEGGYRPAQNGVEAIVSEQPKKLYITLGTNALVFMTDEQFLFYYDQLLTKLQEQLPDSIFYICSLTPTTHATSVNRPVFAYDRMYGVNNKLASMASSKGMHFLNLYEVLAGEDGFLIPEYESPGLKDGIHLVPAAYEKWIQYLMTHTVHRSTNPYVPGSPYYSVEVQIPQEEIGAEQPVEEQPSEQPPEENQEQV